MNTHTQQIILDKIKGENIKPKARWFFVIQHLVLWIPGILVTGIGAVAVAGELYAITHAGWEYRDFVYPSSFDFFIAMVPVIWLVSFALFGSLIVRALRTTHEGYRFSTRAILLGSVSVSIVVGIGAYLLDEEFKADTVIRYPVHTREQALWSSPENGRLSGFIETKIDDIVIVRDKNDELWTIDMSGFGSTTFPFIEEGKSLRIIGTSTDEHVFVACAVFPWEIGEFPRLAHPSPLPLLHQKISILNKNPDCKALLESIKDRIRNH